MRNENCFFSLILNNHQANVADELWEQTGHQYRFVELANLKAEHRKGDTRNYDTCPYLLRAYEELSKKLVGKLGVEDVVRFRGTMSNDALMKEMRKHDIFLFTSDCNEGWEAVANEGMANGCVLVASDAIGSVPYLVRNGENGMVFMSASAKTSFENPDKTALDDLSGKVEWLLNHKDGMKDMQHKAACTMQELWSPKRAAQNLLKLIDALKDGRESLIEEGPCSKA